MAQAQPSQPHCCSPQPSSRRHTPVHSLTVTAHGSLTPTVIDSQSHSLTPTVIDTHTHGHTPPAPDAFIFILPTAVHFRSSRRLLRLCCRFRSIKFRTHYSEAEKHLSGMVVSKVPVAKIDRPQGIAYFQVAKDSNDILNSWAMNTEKLLDLVEKSCHQIHKETVVHKAAPKKLPSRT